jgi:hypothetical protein
MSFLFYALLQYSRFARQPCSHTTNPNLVSQARKFICLQLILADFPSVRWERRMISKHSCKTARVMARFKRRTCTNFARQKRNVNHFQIVLFLSLLLLIHMSHCDFILGSVLITPTFLEITRYKHERPNPDLKPTSTGQGNTSSMTFGSHYPFWATGYILFSPFKPSWVFHHPLTPISLRPSKSHHNQIQILREHSEFS